MNNNTAPEQRPDKNDKTVTRHVKIGEDATLPIVAPAEAPVPVEDAYGDALIAAGTSTDFASMDEGQLKEAVTAVTNRISKDTLWDALEVLTKAAGDTSNKEAFSDAMAENKGSVKLRDTWLSMHGANVAHREVYSKIEGENGYKRYRDSFTKMSEAAAVS